MKFTFFRARTSCCHLVRRDTPSSAGMSRCCDVVARISSLTSPAHYGRCVRPGTVNQRTSGCGRTTQAVNWPQSGLDQHIRVARFVRRALDFHADSRRWSRIAPRESAPDLRTHDCVDDARQPSRWRTHPGADCLQHETRPSYLLPQPAHGGADTQLAPCDRLADHFWTGVRRQQHSSTVRVR